MVSPESLFHYSFTTTLAYLDPGTGSYIFQFIIAGLLGITLAARSFWRRILAFFTALSSKPTSAYRTDEDVLNGTVGPQVLSEKQLALSHTEETKNAKDRS